MTWYAIYTGARKEGAVADHLGQHGVEIFAPTVKEIKRVRHGRTYRMDRVEVAAFPRYVFAKFCAQFFGVLHEEVTSAVGKFSLVSTGRVPVSIRDEIVEELRYLGDYADEHSIKVGDKVAVDGLSGLLATVASVNRLASNQQIGLWVDLLGARREIDVPAHTISAAGS